MSRATAAITQASTQQEKSDKEDMTSTRGRLGFNFTDASAVLLSAEFLLGGIIRLSPWPFTQTHREVHDKSVEVVPLLYPFVPFRSVVGHNRWLGSWFVATGLMLAHPRTRRSAGTCVMVLVWTSTLAYSQFKTGAAYWLPVCNAALASLIWWTG